MKNLMIAVAHLGAALLVGSLFWVALLGCAPAEAVSEPLVEAAPESAPPEQPEPDPAPDPQPTPDPAPIPDPTPDPVPVPDPEPAADPIPDPVPDPIPEPEPIPDPDPIPVPEPDPTPEPDPIPEPDPEPDPVPDPIWGAPELLETDQAGDAYSPQVVVDQDGVVTAVWNQYDGDHFNVMVNRYEGGWGTPVEIDDAGYTAYAADIDVDSLGNVAVLWTQAHEGQKRVNRLACNRFSGTWGPAEDLQEDDLATTTGSALAFEPDGSLVVTWPPVWSRRWSEGWGLADRIGATGGRTRLVSSGATTALWQASGNAIYAARHTDDWSEAVHLGSGQYPQLATDPLGVVTAVWWGPGDDYTAIWASRHVEGWGAAEALDQGTADAESPQVVVDLDGNATAVWIQRDGLRSDIWASRFTGDWGAPELVETEDASAWNPIPAVDFDGVVTVVWLQGDGSDSLWSNRYQGGWGTPELVEHDPGNVSYPALTMDTDGTVVAVWPQDDGERYSIRSSRLEKP